MLYWLNGPTPRSVRHYTVLPRGGNFVAMEYPEVMADDVQAFFGELSDRG